MSPDATSSHRWSCIHEESCNKNCVLFVPWWSEVATSDLSLEFQYLVKRVHPYLGSQRLQITRHKAIYHGSGGGMDNCSCANCWNEMQYTSLASHGALLDFNRLQISKNCHIIQALSCSIADVQALTYSYSTIWPEVPLQTYWLCFNFSSIRDLFSIILRLCIEAELLSNAVTACLIFSENCQHVFQCLITSVSVFNWELECSLNYSINSVYYWLQSLVFCLPCLEPYLNYQTTHNCKNGSCNVRKC